MFFLGEMNVTTQVMTSVQDRSTQANRSYGRGGGGKDRGRNTTQEQRQKKDGGQGEVQQGEERYREILTEDQLLQEKIRQFGRWHDSNTRTFLNFTDAKNLTVIAVGAKTNITKNILDEKTEQRSFQFAINPDDLHQHTMIVVNHNNPRKSHQQETWEYVRSAKRWQCL
jgi:hypothetical protein